MKLRELEGQFVRIGTEPGTIAYVDTIQEAQGVMFLCPLCFVANSGPVGTHRVLCWSATRGVPDDTRPAPGRWALEGTSLDDLTLNGELGKTRSVLLTSEGGCKWHGFVTNGDAA